MSTQPEVSIVIPTRNRWHLLSAHALPSALCQVDVELEVIVVDDGSTDETVAALSRLDEPRVRSLRNSAARGVAGARNTGIAAARGEWVAFLDDDDLWSPTKLRTQLELVDGAASWIFSAVIVVGADRRPLYSLPLPEPGDIASRLLGGNIVPSGPSNVVASTRFLREIGAFDETLVNHTEDWDLWLRLAHSQTPVVCDEVHVASLEHPQRSALRGDWSVVLEAERLLAKHGPVTRRQLLSVAEWLALEQHRGGYRWRAAKFFLRAALAYRSPSNLIAAGGAVFGARGMDRASRLLHRVRGDSHLAASEPDVPSEPAWLHSYRSSSASPHVP
jgi:glycosyltransferase involved in cell wall biosynthesis